MRFLPPFHEWESAKHKKLVINTIDVKLEWRRVKIGLRLAKLWNLNQAHVDPWGTGQECLRADTVTHVTE